jgi:hypothetical protein
MSAYKVIKVTIDSPEHAIAGIRAMGIPSSCIEVHDTPVSLIRYEGSRSGHANVVVRQKDVNSYLSGGMSNDFGVLFNEDETEIHVSDYDTRWWDNKKKNFFQAASLAKVTQHAEEQGYVVDVQEDEETGELLVELISPY